MSSTTRTQLIHQLHAAREGLSHLARAAERAEMIEIDGEPAYAYDALMAAPLELRLTRTLHVVLATGGPHLELVVELADDDTVSDAYTIGAWGSERLELPALEGSGVWYAAEQYAEIAVASTRL